MVPRAGFEPATYRLGGDCSIRLSYRGSEGSSIEQPGGGAKTTKAGGAGLRFQIWWSRPSPNPAQPNYEVHFRLCRLVTNEIVEILADPPVTYPRAEGVGLYPDIIRYVSQTNDAVSPGR